MPFSSRWFYGDTLFIIDVWLWLILGLGIYAARRRAEKERKATTPRADDGVDPDIAGIKIGPQPPAEWQIEEE